MKSLKNLFFYLNSRPKFFKFIIAGVVNTCIHVFAFSFFLYMHISVVFSNVLAFMCANFFSYFASSYFVFNANVHSVYFYFRFLSLSVVGVVLSFVISFFCERLQLHAYMSVLAVVLIMPPVSYLLQRVAFFGGDVSARSIER